MILADATLTETKSKAIMPGVVIGIVIDNVDPEGMGRIKVSFPLQDNVESNWARVVSFSAGNDRGAFFLPQKDDEVLVGFLYGSASMPYILGALWNGIDKPPVEPADQLNINQIKTKSGLMITLNDTEQKESITITDKNNNQIMIDCETNKLSLQANQTIEINCTEGTVAINARIFKVNATESATLTSQMISVTADEETSIKGGIVNIN